MTVLLIIAGLIVAWFVWMVWEYRHAPTAFETEHGYGPVSREHSSERNQRLDSWAPGWEDDVSNVRHGGLGR